MELRKIYVFTDTKNESACSIISSTNRNLWRLLKWKRLFKATYGIGTFYGLSSNNDIKFNDDWYQPMLKLEIKASLNIYKNEINGFIGRD